LAADVLADEAHKSSFGSFAELVIVGRFLADYETSTAIARVEPFRRRGGGAVGAVKPHPRPHFNEWSALGKFCRLLEFNADQRDPLIVLENVQRTDGYSIPTFGLTNGSPIPCGKDRHADDQHWGEDDCGKNDEGFFQVCFCKTGGNETLSSKKAFLSTVRRQKVTRNSGLVVSL